MMQETEHVDYKALYEEVLVENKALKAQVKRLVISDEGMLLTDEEFERAKRKQEIEVANARMLRKVLEENGNGNFRL